MISNFEKKCHQASLRITPQRLEIFRVLSISDEHPTADVVYQKVRVKLPHISLDTVNRTLNTFVDKGLAFAVEGSGDPRRFDGNMADHQHFKCLKCKRIVDFSHEPFDNIDTPDCLGQNFTIIRKSVYFEGFCDKCLQKMSVDIK